MAKKEKKTAAEWFADFPEWGEKAKANTLRSGGRPTLELEHKSAYMALVSSFWFQTATEGQDFWGRIAEGLVGKH